MDFADLYQGCVSYWEKIKRSLRKEEIRHIADKDSPTGRMLGVFTLAYWKRERLIEGGSLVFGYAFKSFQFEGEMRDKVYPSWVLFSPEKAVNENPKVFEGVAAKLGKLVLEEATSKEDKKLKRVLTDNLAVASYIQLDEKYTDGALIYLSIVDVRRSQLPDFRLGYSLLLIGRNISKEVLYLPPAYWSKDYAEAYKKGFKD